MLAAARDEPDVQAVRRRVRAIDGRDAELVPGGDVGVRVRLCDPEGLEHRLVEALRRAAVGRADRDVVEHARRAYDRER
jgi:hypothetical protein